MAFLTWRYCLSVACFLIWVKLSGVAFPRARREWAHLAVTGLLMHAGYLGGVWAAVKAGMGAGLAALIVGLQPVLTGIWLSYVGSRVTPRQWLGLALGLLGLFFVVFHKLDHAGDKFILLFDRWQKNLGHDTETSQKNSERGGVHNRKESSTKHDEDGRNVNKWPNAPTGDHCPDDHADRAKKTN